MKISEPFVVYKGGIKNSRVSFDGKYWYLSFSYELEPIQETLTDEVIGIDLGLKELAVHALPATLKAFHQHNTDHTPVIPAFLIQAQVLQGKTQQAPLL